jgi:hypothetical protein
MVHVSLFHHLVFLNTKYYIIISLDGRQVIE